MNRTGFIMLGVAFAAPMAGCQSQPKGALKAAPHVPLVTIESTEMTSGFALGSLRKQRTLGTYQVFKTPVTLAEFDACVAAGQCSAADSSACSLSSHPVGPHPRSLPYDQKVPSGPAICVGEDQAEAYCRWAGGRLPTLDEWLLAARGSSPLRYSFGSAPKGCDQHPLASQALNPIVPFQRDAGSCFGPDAGAAALAVGEHPAGASPFGVEDVLLAPAELLRPEPDTLFNACSGVSAHCLVTGLSPGAIDSVEPFYQAPNPDGGTHPIVGSAYAFRCVIEAAGDSGT